MVKIIGYYVVFKGHPDTRRQAIRLGVEAGLEVLRQWRAKEPLLIKGSGYSNSGVDAVEKITTTSELDVRRALDAGWGAVSEDELKVLLNAKLNPDGPELRPAGSNHQLSA